ncbi:hypothetical protein KSP40_PGU015088 [Platanthera guangdongensis]|uniref:Uncharacterized protein n=1 Tax=Platanthera guangdongensis TaxID=2320717 RepID=A0ABR2MUX6_9ASPA
MAARSSGDKVVITGVFSASFSTPARSSGARLSPPASAMEGCRRGRRRWDVKSRTRKKTGCEIQRALLRESGAEGVQRSKKPLIWLFCIRDFQKTARPNNLKSTLTAGIELFQPPELRQTEPLSQIDLRNNTFCIQISLEKLCFQCSHGRKNNFKGLLNRETFPLPEDGTVQVAAKGEIHCCTLV